MKLSILFFLPLRSKVLYFFFQKMVRVLSKKQRHLSEVQHPQALNPFNMAQLDNVVSELVVKVPDGENDDDYSCQGLTTDDFFIENGLPRRKKKKDSTIDPMQTAGWSNRSEETTFVLGPPPPYPLHRRDPRLMNEAELTEREVIWLQRKEANLGSIQRCWEPTDCNADIFVTAADEMWEFEDRWYNLRHYKKKQNELRDKLVDGKITYSQYHAEYLMLADMESAKKEEDAWSSSEKYNENTMVDYKIVPSPPSLPFNYSCNPTSIRESKMMYVAGYVIACMIWLMD